jgi:hypothetical protein
MISQNIIICGVVKNVGNKLKPNLDHAIRTGEMFSKYKIVIYENDSTDNTKEILQTYSSHENISILSENVEGSSLKENNKIWAYTEVTGSNHPCRMEHISNARNKLMDEINKPEYDDYSHVIIIDLDSNGWDINGITNSFQRTKEWDVMFANSNPYYDYFALRLSFFAFGPEVVGEPFWKLPNHNFITSELIPVYSAFGGIGIYKKDIFKKYKYHFEVNEEVKKFYKGIIQTHRIPEQLQKFMYNPCNKFPQGYKDDQTEIFYKSNSGYIGQCICEHVPLNLALYNDGYKLFINPKMIYHR